MKLKIILLQKLKKQKLIRKRLSKDIASFDYFDKSLIVFSVTTGSISIGLFATAFEAPIGISSGLLVKNNAK